MSFETALQTAIFTRLSAYQNMPTVYDDVPQDSKGNVIVPFPYVVIGEDTHIAWDTDDSTGAESTITLHVWSRYKGKKEAKDILGLIYSALNRYELTVPGYNVVTLEYEYSDVLLDPDGLSRHGVCRYRSLIES